MRAIRCQLITSILWCVALVGLLYVIITPASSRATLVRANWDCSTRLLSDYTPKANEPDVGEGVSYLYVGNRDLHTNYGADALFVTLLDGKRGWYDSGVRLGPLKENNGFVQIEVSRWERFDYRPHIAVSWGMPNSATSEYKDTGIMLNESTPHRLGIFVRDGRVQLLVDNHVICSADASIFVSAKESKYFQIRTETSVVGRNTRAVVSDLRLKRDDDAAAQRFATNCVMHRYGVFWESQDTGSFTARGAFYPNEATFFTGVNPATPPTCVT